MVLKKNTHLDIGYHVTTYKSYMGTSGIAHHYILIQIYEDIFKLEYCAPPNH